MMYDPKTRDEAFIAMMHDFVQSHTNQNASTESFKAVVDKHITPGMDVEGNKRMDWFFSQWIYGTDFRVTSSTTKWRRPREIIW